MARPPVRVLHILRRMHFGGAETLLMRLYRRIDRQRVQFDFALHSDESGAFDEEIEALGGRIYRIPEPREKPIRFLNELAVVLRDGGPFHVVHSHVHHFSGIILPMARFYRVPIRISHSHLAGSHLIESGSVDSVKRRIYKAIMSKLIRANGTHFLGCSEDACTELFGDMKAARIFPNALEIDSFEGSTETDLRDQLGIPNGTKVILHIGRFSLQKNHAFLLHIFDFIRKSHPNIVLLLVGEGELEGQINATIQGLQLSDCVYSLGTRTDIPYLFSISDLFLFPSVTEGLGNVLIEAQLAGVPCIASSTVPQAADMGLGIFEFRKLDAPKEEWLSAVYQLLDKPRLPWIDRKRRIMELGYDIADAVNTLERIYVDSV